MNPQSSWFPAYYSIKLRAVYTVDIGPLRGVRRKGKRGRGHMGRGENAGWVPTARGAATRPPLHRSAGAPGSRETARPAGEKAVAPHAVFAEGGSWRGLDNTEERSSVVSRGTVSRAGRKTGRPKPGGSSRLSGNMTASRTGRSVTERRSRRDVAALRQVASGRGIPKFMKDFTWDPGGTMNCKVAAKRLLHLHFSRFPPRNGKKQERIIPFR